MVDINKIAFQSGFKSSDDFLLKFVLPILVLSFGLFFMMMTLIGAGLIISFLILVFGISFIFIYPFILHERKKVNINENIHLFITYSGTIATLKIGRAIFFRRIAQKKIFGELSIVSNKIFYFAKQWNLGFAQTCRKVGRLIPSELFADFLDRFAVVMDFGQDLDVFLIDEQDSLMEAYGTQYKQSLENIKMIQNVFLSLTISAAFLMSVGILLPLLLGTPIDTVLLYSLLGIIGMDVVIFVLVLAFIPSDRIPHTLPIKSEGMLKMKKAMYIYYPIAGILFLTLVIIHRLPFMVNIAIGFSPLFMIGYYAKQEEEIILRREALFPSFMRTLGSAIQSRGGAIMSALFSIRVHDFSHINLMIVNLYRRLRLGSDKIKSWLYFAAESGSHLIFHFSRIFSESVYLGGDAEKIGEIVSKNCNHLNGLRKLRLQLTGSMRGSFYGALIGFSAAIYMTLEVANMLAEIFMQPLQDASDSSLGDVVTSLTPNIPTVDMVTAGIYLAIMITIHALISSILLKVVDGGFKTGAFMDFIGMLMIGMIISIVIPLIAGTAFPGLGLVSS